MALTILSDRWTFSPKVTSYYYIVVYCGLECRDSSFRAIKDSLTRKVQIFGPSSGFLIFSLTSTAYLYWRLTTFGDDEFKLVNFKIHYLLLILFLFNIIMIFLDYRWLVARISSLWNHLRFHSELYLIVEYHLYEITRVLHI